MESFISADFLPPFSIHEINHLNIRGPLLARDSPKIDDTMGVIIPIVNPLKIATNIINNINPSRRDLYFNR